MKTPFEFGKVVIGDAFTNRNEYIKRLGANFTNSINTTIISPRRWGKSSLVRKTANEIIKDNSNIKFCFIDLYNIRAEEDFYAEYARQVIKASSTKFEDWIKTVGLFIKKLKPQISISADSEQSFSLGFEINELKKNPEEIINLPERIAEKNNIKMVICIDEFQNIGSFENPLFFQKQLRSYWQHHQNVSYCIYGSKRHMIIELFEKKSMPFYRFGDIINLDKISQTHLINFIVSSFKRTNKKIDNKYAERIVIKVKSHPYYVQQLAHIIWESTDYEVNNENIDKGIEDLIRTNSLFYESEIENISNSQINLLKAVVSKAEKLSSTQVMQEFKLGTSANVIKNKRILERKEILNKVGKDYEIEDPVFELWFQGRFM